MLTKKEVDEIKKELGKHCCYSICFSNDQVYGLMKTVEEMEKVIRGCDQELRDICKTMGQNYDSPRVTSLTKGFLAKYEGKGYNMTNEKECREYGTLCADNECWWEKEVENED
jgi:hypothetical protein